MPRQTSSDRDSGTSLAQIRAQVLDRARRDPSPTRDERARSDRRVVWAVTVVPLLLFWAAGGMRSAPRPVLLVVESALGAALVALGAAWVAIGRGRSMLGSPASRLLALALGTPLLLFAWKVFVTSGCPDMMVAWSERPGFRCLGLSLCLGSVPIVGLVWMRRNSDPIHARLSGAAIGAAVGAVVWVLVDLWCPVGYVPHLLLGHVLPLIVAIASSAFLGGRVLALRGREAR
jgi:hypothetical protein